MMLTRIILLIVTICQLWSDDDVVTAVGTDNDDQGTKL